MATGRASYTPAPSTVPISGTDGKLAPGWFNTVPVADNAWYIYDDADATKRLQFDVGSVSAAVTTTIKAPANTSSYTYNLPLVSASDTIACLGLAQTFTATQTFSGGVVFSGAVSVIDGNFSITGSSDATKIAKFEVDGLTTGTTRTYTLPDASITVAGINLAQTWTAVQTHSSDLTLTGTATLTTVATAAISGTATAGTVLRIGSTNAATGTTQLGISVPMTATSAATTSIRAFSSAIGTAAAAFTCADVIGFKVGAHALGAGSTITRGSGFVSDQLTNATNNCGFYYGTAPAFTGNWAFYNATTDASYFGGAVTCNTTLAVNGAATLSGTATLNGATGQVLILNTTDGTNGSFILLRNSSSSFCKIGAAVGAAGVGGIADTAINASGGALYMFGGSQQGMKMDTSAGAARVGLYSTTPTIQYATTGTSTGFTAGAGTTATSLSTFTGNTGSTAYTTGDIVRALKLIGIMAA